MGLTKLVASIAVHGMRAKECERIDVLRGKERDDLRVRARMAECDWCYVLYGPALR